MMQQKKSNQHEMMLRSSDALDLRELLHSLTRCFDACERHTTRGGEPLPSSYAQALIILLDFALRGATPTLSDLVELLDIDKSNVTRLCQRMQESGHVQITRDPKDRRAKRIELTEDGEDLSRFIQDASMDRYEEVLSFFKHSERAALLEQLMKLNASLTKLID